MMRTLALNELKFAVNIPQTHVLGHMFLSLSLRFIENHKRIGLAIKFCNCNIFTAFIGVYRT